MPMSRRSALRSLGALAASAFLPVKGRAAPSTCIGIIGAGSLGGTVGRLWVQAGHEVLFSSRHPEEIVPMIRQLGPRASAGTPRQAAEFGSVLLFAVPRTLLQAAGLAPGKLEEALAAQREVASSCRKPSRWPSRPSTP